MQINDFMEENDKLTRNVDKLAGNVGELEEVEKSLSKLVKSNNVDRLVKIVVETRIVNEKLKVRSYVCWYSYCE